MLQNPFTLLYYTGNTDMSSGWFGVITLNLFGGRER
jgi:hypothetical protein